jgi:Baseplate J-like protein
MTTPTQTKDRRESISLSTTVNGIDFVEVANPDQKTLRVHFLSTVTVKGSVNNISIDGGDTIPTVPVKEVLTINDSSHWSTEAGRPVLTITVDAPGDFSRYRLDIESDLLDPFFNQTSFSFKALCPSDLDCQTPPPFCPPEEIDLPAIDYLAKDFLSFRQALLDFSALRYPGWAERSEADFGMMFLEAVAALADDLSYTQDRIAAEAFLATATQRRSIVRHARLVNYEPRPATAARVLLQVDVKTGRDLLGLLVSAQTPAGGSIDFEVGMGLGDTIKYHAEPVWNRGIQPYYWDDSQRCLKAGATDMWVEGHGFNFYAGQELLIESPGDTSADPEIRQVVRLADRVAEEGHDDLYHQPVTHIFWLPMDALGHDRDLTKQADGTSNTILAGNLAPATQGKTTRETFFIPDENLTLPLSTITPALARTGNNSTNDDPVIQYLYPLSNSPLVWLQPQNPERNPRPEIQLRQLLTDKDWQWQRSLLRADRFQSAFTIDPVKYQRVNRLGDQSTLYDYDSDRGITLRFGDGIFGEQPDPGERFQVTYRLGGGAIGNVAAEAITGFDPATSGVVRVSNPFPATGGADAEANDRVRQMAPQAFRAKQFRAVRAEDYRRAAESLPWVQRAGTVFRWTGSWLTVFTTPDPQGSEVLTIKQHTELIDLLNRYRLAGYESYVPAPRYISLDLEISLCARPDAWQGDVEVAVLKTLSAAKQVDSYIGFFHVDRWTFGQRLERSVLESAIQSAPGVAGVVNIRYRQRGTLSGYQDLPDIFPIPIDAILRVDNDNNHPERGTLKLLLEGGK